MSDVCVAVKSSDEQRGMVRQSQTGQVYLYYVNWVFVGYPLRTPPLPEEDEDEEEE